MIKISLVFVAICLLAACVNLKIEIPQDPLFTLEYEAILTEVNQAADFSKKIADQVINTKSPKVTYLIKVQSIEKKRKLVWRWYNPKEELVFQSEPILVNQNTKFLEFFIAWNSLENTKFKNNPGEWKVVVFFDGAFFHQRRFDIKKK